MGDMEHWQLLIMDDIEDMEPWQLRLNLLEALEKIQKLEAEAIESDEQLIVAHQKAQIAEKMFADVANGKCVPVFDYAHACKRYETAETKLAQVEKTNFELEKALKKMISVGSECYDMDMGENGAEAIKQARVALGIKEDEED